MTEVITYCLHNHIADPGLRHELGMGSRERHVDVFVQGRTPQEAVAALVDVAIYATVTDPMFAEASDRIAAPLAEAGLWDGAPPGTFVYAVATVGIGKVHNVVRLRPNGSMTLVGDLFFASDGLVNFVAAPDRDLQDDSPDRADQPGSGGAMSREQLLAAAAANASTLATLDAIVDLLRVRQREFAARAAELGAVAQFVRATGVTRARVSQLSSIRSTDPVAVTHPQELARVAVMRNLTPADLGQWLAEVLQRAENPLEGIR